MIQRAQPQLRNDCLSFWSVKAELGLRGPRREGPVFFKIWYHSASLAGLPTPTALYHSAQGWTHAVGPTLGHQKHSQPYKGCIQKNSLSVAI